MIYENQVCEEQKHWLDEATSEELCRLINAGYNEEGILRNFKITFDENKLGKLVLDLENYGYKYTRISNIVYITIKDDLKF